MSEIIMGIILAPIGIVALLFIMCLLFSMLDMLICDGAVQEYVSISVRKWLNDKWGDNE